MTTYTDISSPYQLTTGDVLLSGSGVYSASLGTNYTFNIYHGSTPGGTPVWSTTVPSDVISVVNPAVTAFGSALRVSGTETTPSFYGFATLYQSGTPNSVNSFGALSDAGQLSIITGTSSSPGSTIWTSPNAGDAVKSIALQTIDYDLTPADDTITASPVSEASAQTCNNTTPTAQTCALTVSHTYTKTQSWTWNLSDALTGGITSTVGVSVKVPEVATVSGSVAVNISSTTTISGGESGSTSTSEMYSDTVSVKTPPDSDYNLLLTAQDVSYAVPYAFTGIATYESGVTANVTGSGIFNGEDTTDFVDTIGCVSYKGGACPVGLDLGAPGPISEPSSVALCATLLAVVVTRLPAYALCAGAVVRGFRLTRGRFEGSRRRSAGPLMGSAA